MILIFFNTLPMSRQKTCRISCIFPVIPKKTHSCFLRIVLFVSVGSSCASVYYPNTHVHCFFKSIWHPVTISLGRYFIGIPFLSDSTFKYIITKYTIWMMIWDGRQEYVNFLMIPLTFYLTVLVVLSTSPTCYRAASMLNSTFLKFSTTFLNSMPISITGIKTAFSI